MLHQLFHPITADWFASQFGEPTEPQALGWPAIAAGLNTLIAAPTGSGKTLAAFLFCIDRLVRGGLEQGLENETSVVYVSPLKALSNDVHRNLEMPLAGLRHTAEAAGLDLPAIRTAVRTGDTSAAERQAMVRKPPHVLVTTPESLYLLLTSPKGRETLRTTKTVIVDEIHALARDKRGSHLSLSLERLEALCPSPPVRIGLSATQRPIDEIARFLVGAKRVDADGRPDCRIIDAGHVRALDLAVEVPPTDLSAVCSNDLWSEIHQRIAGLIESHRSTLVFVNTRRLAERICHHLSERLGEGMVASHHGSLSRAIRLDAEERLKAGELKAIVATASLELGIDVGFIDLVCQIGSPRSIATFLQRVGRSGHALGLVPKGRLFPLSRDELIECLALLRAVRVGRLDAIELPRRPLDVLSQQIVAATACDDWSEDALFDLCRAAWPYRSLDRREFDELLEMLSEGVCAAAANTTAGDSDANTGTPGAWRVARPGFSGRRGAYLHRDRIHGRVRARRGARITATTSGGVIPETGDFRVVTHDDRTFVGTVNEDFAIESMAGEVFLLGNTSWRIHWIRGGELIVSDANGAPATIPFWLGEAPARTVELSQEVSQLRREIENRLENDSTEPAVTFLKAHCGADAATARQAAVYVAAQKQAIGLAPTQDRIVFERFFDDSGGMQLVIHSPWGARINRAWGLALRKRFCRSFDFELQASADDDGIVLSLGPQHSVAIENLFRMLNTRNGPYLLTQALLAVPMFRIRWRWNATRALAVPRQRNGQRIPPNLQRMRADDLLAAVFPQSAGCLENHSGDVAIPDHPLVRQTVHDCLHEAMDVDGWRDVLAKIESGAIELIARDTREPSPFSYELLNANPYAFLDNAPLEERRARAVATRRTLGEGDLSELGRLDPDAIAEVQADAWPTVRDRDELHDALLWMVALAESEGHAWGEWFAELVHEGRATTVVRPDGRRFWVAAERWPLARAAFPDSVPEEPLLLPECLRAEPPAEIGLVELVRGRLECCGPTTVMALANQFGLRRDAAEAALEALEGEGFVLRGNYTRTTDETEWCERRLLARIHRLTLEGARRKVQPVEASVFLNFLLEHQHVETACRLDGPAGLRAIVHQLQGFELPAGEWEREVFGSRLIDYDSDWLDELTCSGELIWGRLRRPRINGGGASALTRVAPISFARRSDLSWLLSLERETDQDERAHGLHSNAQQVYEVLTKHGALFLEELVTATGLLPGHVSEALAELAAAGLVTADGFAAVRPLVGTSRRTSPTFGRRRRRIGVAAGRWSRFPAGPVRPPDAGERLHAWCQQLLRRYGVVFRDLLAREVTAPIWSDLVRVFRRLEAKGEILGGRFVGGVAGEQFALPQSVEHLRRVRDRGSDSSWHVLAAADPLNFVGILTPGPRLAATRKSAFVLRDGRVLATRHGHEITYLEPVEPFLADRISHALKRSATHRPCVS